ncbi:MAG: putative HMP/thiamine import ATP-binding protein YkoD [Promethearchaeota archaeon]|nr:MAG: putative HMP/thiamine import ATP-binding protein YkoD [Candidatus Lokiarchaeota archaeon]
MELNKLVGLVTQNPLEQLVTFTVRDEIAFGLENLKYPREEIEERIESISQFLGISHLLDREVNQLSGGQMQLTILSSFLVMNPKLLILDEPIAYLDQKSESLLLDRLKRLIRSENYDLTLIIIEHRLSRILDIADKIVVLTQDGTIALQGEISTVLKNNFNQLKDCNLRIPWLLNVFQEFDQSLNNFFYFQDALNLLENLSKSRLNQLKDILISKEIHPDYLKKYENFDTLIEFDNLYIERMKNSTNDNRGNKDKSHRLTETLSSPAINKKVILEIRNLTFAYPNSDIRALKDVSFTIEEGDFIGLVGPNGSGKTTLLYLLARLYEPQSGEILYKNTNVRELDEYEYAKKIGFIFQNPESMIFKRTIKEEILYGPTNFDILDQINDDYIEKLISLIGDESADKNPFNLSWGQKRRLNLSSIFVYQPEIILLDEPFIGQDQNTIEELIETLYIEHKRGKTIIISSHDYHLLMKYTKKIIELNQDGTLRDYDTNGNYFKRHSNLGPIILLNEINRQLQKKMRKEE